MILHKLDTKKQMHSFHFKNLLSILLILNQIITVSLAESPYEVTCPQYSLIRESNGKLCIEEIEYLKHKANFTSNSIINFLKQYENDELSWSDHTLESILNSPPYWGLALSGGGYRSMLISSGIIKEMHKISLFDCLTYISGLSGGSWVLMDLILHDFDPDQILKNWDFKNGLLEGVPDFDLKSTDIISGMNELNLTQLTKRSNISFTALYNYNHTLSKRNTDSWYMKLKRILAFDKQDSTDKLIPMDHFKLIKNILNFYISLHLEVKVKKIKGFSLSFTDYWGKALLKRLQTKISSETGSFSFYQLIRQTSKFQQKQAPILIFIANCKNDHMKNFIFEFTPFEFGSWEPSAQIFINLRYLGSKIVKGIAEKCFHDFDDLGFIAATSSSIFNNAILYIWKGMSDSSKEIVDTVKALMSIFGLSNSFEGHLSNNHTDTMIETDYAIYKPNPYFHYDNDKINPSLTEKDYLYLVDGGEDGENIPMRTLLIPERNLEAIFIMDSSSDKENYTNGTKLETILNISKQYGVDYLQSDADLFENFQPTEPKVLGCYLGNTQGDKKPPVLIYMANTDHSFSSNTSTFKVTYNDIELNNMLQSAEMIFTGDENKYYEKCLPCFLLKRRIDREVTTFEQETLEHDFCLKCYENFCIN